MAGRHPLRCSGTTAQTVGRLGAPCLPTLPYRQKVWVKVKKWHKDGGLVAPFVEATVLCPSHLVNGGWAVQLQDGRVLHVREAVQTNQEGEQLRIQQGVQGDMVELHLEEDKCPGQPHRRLTGKQPLGNTPRMGDTTAVVTATGPSSAGEKYSSSSSPLRPNASTSNLWQDAPENFPSSSTSASAKGVRSTSPGRHVRQIRMEGERSSVQVAAHQGEKWKTSKPELVNSDDWVRFCGFEMKYKGDDLLVGQPSYLQDLLRRRKITAKRSTPLPAGGGGQCQDRGDPPGSGHSWRNLVGGSAQSSGPCVCYWGTGESSDKKVTLGATSRVLHPGVFERH